MSKVSKILERLNLAIPVECSVPNPFHPEDAITLSRANLAALLMHDGKSSLDGQTVAALMGEMALFKAGCKLASEKKGIDFRQWKSDRVREVQDDYELVGVESVGKITDKLRESYYRNAEGYEEHTLAAKQYDVLSGLFNDLFTAFGKKSDQLKSNDYIANRLDSGRGAERDNAVSNVDAAADEERLEDMADMSGSADEAAEYLARRAEHAEEAAEADAADDDDDDEADEGEDDQADDGDDDDEDDEPEAALPPPPPRRTTKAKATKSPAKKTTKKTTKKKTTKRRTAS